RDSVRGRGAIVGATESRSILARPLSEGAVVFLRAAEAAGAPALRYRHAKDQYSQLSRGNARNLPGDQPADRAESDSGTSADLTRRARAAHEGPPRGDHAHRAGAARP